MEHLKLESATDSPEFWNDAYAISSYCNSLLGATGKSDYVVSIYIEDYDGRPRVGYRREEQLNKFSIFLPKIKDFYSNEALLEDDVKLRKAFLKHEVAHIIYSDMESYMEHHQNDTSDLMFLNNALEDVRIEWAFGKRFQGANDTFFDVQRKFFNRGKSKIEIDPPNIKNLAFYFMYRSKKFEFDNTLSTEIYDKIFSKYSDFLSLSRKEISELIREISKDFYSETKSREDDIKQYQEYLDETYPTQEMEEGDYRDEDEAEEDGQGESSYNPNSTVKSKEPQKSMGGGGSPSNESPENKEDSNQSSGSGSSNQKNEVQEESKEDSSSDEEEFDEEDDEESEDSDTGSGSDSESEEEEFDEDSDEEDYEDEEEEESDEFEDKEDDRDFKPNDFSNMLVDELNRNLQDELDDFKEDSNDDGIKKGSSEKFKSQLENHLDTIDNDNGEQVRVIDMLKMIKGLDYNLVDTVAESQQTLNEFVKYNNSKMKHLGSKVIDASRFLYLSNSRKRKKRKNDPDVRSRYSLIVAKNNKNIISLVNYFKLKFQDKEKSKRFFNKEEGDLNNESLYKILNKNQFDMRIFSRLEKSLVTKEDVSFLLDFSGSMEGYKLKDLLESLVVMNEVFTKIGIPFNVFSFSGKDYNYIDFKYNSLSEKMALQKMFTTKLFIQDKTYSNDSISFKVIDQFRTRDFKIVYCLINRSTRPEERKKIIDLLLNCANNNRTFKSWGNFFSGSTPECQAVIGVYNALPKQKLFIINDGEYDSLSFHSKELDLIKESANSKPPDHLAFYNFIYDFLIGKEIILKNLEDEKVFRVASDFASSLLYKSLRGSNLFKFFEDKNDNSITNQNQEVFKKLDDVFSDLNYCLYKINKDNFYKGRYFTIERKYYQKKDINHLVITREAIPTFSLKVTRKTIPANEIFDHKYYYSNLVDLQELLYLSKDVIDDFNDLLKMQFFLNFNSFFEAGYSTVRNEYTYKDLFNKMRSSGWEIYGIGIGNSAPENYIGKQNFACIKNSEDLRTNLEKKIKKIV